jgi:tetratricopeptide (TPR) repeat protein
MDPTAVTHAPASLFSCDIPRLLRSAVSHHRAGRRLQAQRLYVEVLRLQPQHPEALHHLGVLALQSGEVQAAAALIRRAVASPAAPAAWRSNLAVALKSAGRADEALACYDRAIELAPADAHAHYNRAILLKDMLRLPEAIEGYSRALALKPDHHGAAGNLALALLLAGEFERGWALYESRWQRVESVRSRSGRPVTHWTGRAPLAGRSLLLWSEQGLGDTLQFCRYASLAAERGAHVALRVQPELVALMQSLAGVHEIGPVQEGEVAADLHAPLMSLPLAFGTRVETIPARDAYLRAPRDRVAAWERRLGPKTRPRVGLAWSGSPRTEDRGRRSIALAELAASLPADWDWISLQRDVKPQDEPALRSHAQLRHFGPELHDFVDTAALCELVDLVVSVDTSVVHLAGALGKPDWVLLPFSPDWRWLLDREDSPWYPSMRLWRQPRPGDWSAVLARVGDALAAH